MAQQDLLKWAENFFENDRFAKNAGIKIIAAERGYAVCEMNIEEMHLNAANTVMGGAIFTLADFAFGIASNADQPPTVTMSASISYMGVCKGKRLIAVSKCEKDGRSSCVHTIRIDDELGNHVAMVNAIGFRKSK
ncbi:MAG: PaaI family thioesterase [Clostridia bacterium]|nr:PaaI family thioesterase [Clostridia bacterium]